MTIFKTTVFVFAVLIAAVLAVARTFRRLSAPSSIEDRGPINDRTRVARRPVRHWLLRLTAFGIVALLGGFLLMTSGVVPIKASSRHWPITAWLLEFAMQRSVATHSLAVKAPPLKDRALMVKGAGHYEIGCRPCHGSPESRQLPPVARAMTPHPPELFRELPKWNAKQLFYIVKHGVKFTGMPAWPAQQRDDEVWAVVAFLLELPWLTAGEYRRLVSGQNSVRSEDAPLKDLAGPEKRPPALIESCAACHGLDGRGRGLGSFPKLAGQRPTYLSASLQAYAHGQRHSGIMQPIAAGLSSEAIRVTARYYTDLIGSFQPQAAGAPLQRSLINEPGQYGHGATDTAAIERGREIAARGIPPQGVPSCIDCHGPGTALRNPIYPNLAGQYADYLILQLELFQAQRRGGTPYAHIMRRIAGRLNHSQMRDVALYYSSLTSTDGALRE